MPPNPSLSLLPNANHVHNPHLPFLLQTATFWDNFSSEYFQKRMWEFLSGLPGVLNLMEDVLFFGKDQAEHDRNLHKTLRRLEQNGVTLNKTRCVFSTREVTFLDVLYHDTVFDGSQQRSGQSEIFWLQRILPASVESLKWRSIWKGFFRT